MGAIKSFAAQAVVPVLSAVGGVLVWETGHLLRRKWRSRKATKTVEVVETSEAAA